MRSSRAFLIFALAAGGLVGGSPRATGPAESGTSSANMPQVIRVLYLQGMDLNDASALLRTQVPVRQMATIRDRGVMVVSDVADRVDQCEKLLRERGAVVRTADPHKPLELERLAQSPTAAQVFRVDRDDMKTVVVLLRSIYQLREVNELAEANGVSVRAAQPILDASEALLRELGLLVESTKRSGGS